MSAAQLDPTDLKIRRLLSLANTNQPPVEIGATWVIKNLAERRRGTPLPGQLAYSLVQRLRLLEETRSKLHLLQTLPFCTLGKAACDRLRSYLLDLERIETNGLARAWLFNGFAEVARCDPGLQDQAVAILSAAYEGERAAGRARIRKRVGVDLERIGRGVAAFLSL